MLTSSEKPLLYDQFREMNAYYDDCLRAQNENKNKSEITFQKALIDCRLHNPVEGIRGYSIVDFLDYLSQLDYYQFLLDAQPKQKDIIKRYSYPPTGNESNRNTCLSNVDGCDERSSAQLGARFSADSGADNMTSIGSLPLNQNTILHTLAFTFCFVPIDSQLIIIQGAFI